MRPFDSRQAESLSLPSTPFITSLMFSVVKQATRGAQILAQQFAPSFHAAPGSWSTIRSVIGLVVCAMRLQLLTCSQQRHLGFWEQCRALLFGKPLKAEIEISRLDKEFSPQVASLRTRSLPLSLYKITGQRHGVFTSRLKRRRQLRVHASPTVYMLTFVIK
jgi:hypothetical protein